MKTLFSIFTLTLALSLSACSSTKVDPDIETMFPKISDADYNKLIDTNTQRDRRYSGLQNTYQMHTTLLNTKVRLATLKKQAYYMQWDAAKARNEREKVFQENSSKTKFFLSFFAPEREHNDLNKANSMWKVYLDFNASRYEGKVTKINTKKTQLMTMFPYYSRFDTPYEISFKVPMTAIEDGSCKLTLTSSLGTTSFDF